MLNYFPMPYENELWYSVLCRFHVRVGSPYQGVQPTLSEFMNRKEIVNAYVNPKSVNKTIPLAVAQLPKGLLTSEEIILHHTLFPFFTRFYSWPAKTELMESIISDMISFTPKISRNGLSDKKLKYCPLCVQEDRNRYGEAYWHTVHQIPLVTHCPTHYCRLNSPSEMTGPLVYTFYPLECQTINEEVCYDMDETNKALNNIMVEYYSLPFSDCPQMESNNLATAIYANTKSNILAQAQEREMASDFYETLVREFGKDLALRIFGKMITPTKLQRLSFWNPNKIEQYALIQLHFGISTTTLLSNGF